MRASTIKPLQARQMKKVHDLVQYNFLNVIIAQLSDKYKVKYKDIEEVIRERSQHNNVCLQCNQNSVFTTCKSCTCPRFCPQPPSPAEPRNPKKEFIDHQMNLIADNAQMSIMKPFMSSTPSDLNGTNAMKCCGGLGLMGKCGRGTKKGCNGVHCKCMEDACGNMHYVDCFEHYIHLEHVEKSIEVILAPAGTPLARFQKERTDAISEMFDGEDTNGIYPTSHFFARLDKCFSEELSRISKEAEERGRRKGYKLGYYGKDSYKSDLYIAEATAAAYDKAIHITLPPEINLTL